MRSSLDSDEGQGAKVQSSCATADAVPAACLIGQHNGVIHGHSRVHGHTARPAFELTDTPGPEASKLVMKRKTQALPEDAVAIGERLDPAGLRSRRWRRCHGGLH